MLALRRLGAALRRLDRRSSDGTMANVQGEVPALGVGACLEGLGWGLLEGSACLAGGACPEGLGWGAALRGGGAALW